MRFALLVFMFFAAVALVAAVLIGVTMQIIGLVFVALVAFGVALWAANKLRLPKDNARRIEPPPA